MFKWRWWVGTWILWIRRSGVRLGWIAGYIIYFLSGTNICLSIYWTFLLYACFDFYSMHRTTWLLKSASTWMPLGERVCTWDTSSLILWVCAWNVYLDTFPPNILLFHHFSYLAPAKSLTIDRNHEALAIIHCRIFAWSHINFWERRCTIKVWYSGHF